VIDTPKVDASAGLALSMLSAVWATRAGTLPGQSLPVLGPAIQSLVWAALYIGLAQAYRTVLPNDRHSVRRTLLRLGCCLSLALLATYLCQRFLDARSPSSSWADLFYLRWLLPPIFVGLWCRAFLPRETRAIIGRVDSNPATALGWRLAALLAAAAILVSCSDLAFAFQRGGGAVQTRLSTDEIWARSWALNILILCSAYAIVFAATRRVSAALLAVSPLYALLALATLLKIKYMHSAIQPLDLIRLPELLPLFRSFFGTGAVLAIGIGLAIWVSALLAVRKARPSWISSATRWSMALLGIVILVAFPTLISLARSFPSMYEPLGLAGVPTGQQREQARRHGFLLSFLSEIPWIFVSQPPNYSPASVASALSKYWSPGSTTGPNSGHRVNLIVYLVESFVDPDDLGIRYTADPIPNFRTLRVEHTGGHSIVPGRFGGSANTEFEALTGMAISLLPTGSVPYRQYVKRRIPSLPLALRGLGYATTAVQADPRYYYNREWVYNLLGFDSVVWLRGAPGVERAARGSWPADRAVVNAIIHASQAAKPFFIFAFPSSTHGPYNTQAYRNSDLDVIDAPSGAGASEVKEYVNTLRVADDAIGALIQHFTHQPDSTIIAVLGDHLPPLTSNALRPFFMRLSGASTVEQARLTHRVPLLVWANFRLPREDKELGVHALPTYLLNKMGIVPTGFLAVSDAVRRELPVLEAYVRGADGTVWDWNSVPADKQRLIDDYRLLQYDLLLGEQFSLRDGASSPGLPQPQERAASR
jgi:hypothetical protein